MATEVASISSVLVLSHVQIFVILWTVAHQAPLSTGFFRQEYWGGLHFLLQGIFLTQGSNLHLLCLLHCRQILHQLSHKGSPRIREWVTYPFSSRSSQTRNQTGVSHIAGRFLTK